MSANVQSMKTTEIWNKHAPPLPNELERLEEAFYALFPIVRFCPHLGAKAKFPQECTHEHPAGAGSWQCRCCQSHRFRNIFGRYVSSLHPKLSTELTGTKIENRAYGFRKWRSRIYFKIRRHPPLDEESYMETEQIWFLDLQSKQLTWSREEQLGGCSALI